ncbi:MAG: hypothetical protein SF053_21075 [Bacteroidia bacterium]|nr:hypothetical protein [Bacteroidia bacterium]
MKNITLILILSLCASAVAQNAMFIPFGQTRQEVNAYLDTREYVFRRMDRLPDTLGLRFSLPREVDYVFKENVLYAVRDERRVTDRKDAERLLKTCLDYMSMGNQRVRNVDSPNGVQHYATIKDDRLIELITIPPRQKTEPTVIILQVTSRYHGPRMQTENLVTQISRK